MNIRDYLQKKKLAKLRQEDPTTYLEGLIERKLGVITGFFEESIDKVKLNAGDFIATINTVFENKKEELSRYVYDRTEQVLEICIQRIDTYLENNRPEKGDSYILTEEDRQAIAQGIQVPVVEKVIEKHYTVVKGKNETPIVVEAVTDTGEEIAEKLNALPDSLSIRVIRGLQEELESIKRTIRRRNQISGGGGGGGGTGSTSTITVSDTDPTGSATDGDIHLVTDDGTTGGVVIDTFLYDGVWIKTTEPDYEKCKNVTGSTITKGKIVYVNGANGSLPTITLADNTTETTSSKTIGLVAKNITNNSDGYFIRSGLLIGIDTSSFSAGDTLWLGTSGNITNTRPTAPNHAVFVGYALTSAVNGRMLVSIMNGYELDELHNVLISTPTDGQVLTYESATGLWKNETPTGGAGSLTLTTTEINLGSVPKRNGNFTITTSGLTSGKSVLIQQAVGPYTGKGTLADEAEMDGLSVSASTTSTTTIKAYWTSPSPVKGNFKFNYLVSA